jgi:anthrone oxygenase-like protein
MLIAFAAFLWAAIIVFTATTIVSINNRIAKMNAARPYDGWLEDRARWDLLHSIRVAVLVISVISQAYSR